MELIDYMNSYVYLQDIIGIIHNSFEDNESWRGHSKFELKQIIDVLFELSDKENITKIEYQKSILKLEDLSIDTSPKPLAFIKTNIDCVGAT